MSEFVLSNPENVWDMLKKFAVNELSPDDVTLKFEEFPKVIVKYVGSGFDSALPIRSMDALKAIQYEIYKLYSLAVYNDESQNLSKDEKDNLELFFHVKKGSSETEPINLREVLYKIIDKAAEHMEPKHYIIIVGIVVAGWTYSDIAHKYIESEAQVQTLQIQAEKEKHQQNKETERLAIIKSIVTSNPAAKKAIESVDRTVEAIAKSVKGDEKVIMTDNTEITEKVAKEMYPRSKRRSVEELRMDGLYTVKMITRENDELKVKILDEKGKEFQATTGSMDQILINQLSNAIAKDIELNLKINAKNFEGELKDLKILEAVNPTTSTAQVDQ